MCAIEQGATVFSIASVAAAASPLPLSPNQLYLSTGSFGLGSGLSESGSQSSLGIVGMDAIAHSAVAAANSAVLASQRRTKAVLPVSMIHATHRRASQPRRHGGVSDLRARSAKPESRVDLERRHEPRAVARARRLA